METKELRRLNFEMLTDSFDSDIDLATERLRTVPDEIVPTERKIVATLLYDFSHTVMVMQTFNLLEDSDAEQLLETINFACEVIIGILINRNQPIDFPENEKTIES